MNKKVRIDYTNPTTILSLIDAVLTTWKAKKVIGVGALVVIDTLMNPIPKKVLKRKTHGKS